MVDVMRRVAGAVFGVSMIALASVVASTGSVRVIVQPASSPAAAIAALESVGAQDVVSHDAVGLVHATVAGSTVDALRSRPEFAGLAIDHRLRTSTDAPQAGSDGVDLTEVRDVIGADWWHARGVTGDGIDVAVIDTGISASGSLANRVRNGSDVSFDGGDADRAFRDDFGHGTHMAGIVHGIAPDAGIVNVKVADRNGVADVTQVIAGIDWVIQHRKADGLNVELLNLSLGTAARQGWQIDPLAYAAEAAWRNGITVIVSGGNRGAGAGGLDMPAAHPRLVAVAASDTKDTVTVQDDVVASFSSSGSTARSPDITAPGARIISARVPGSALDQQYPSARVGDGFRGSGSSQAAAVVSGAAALLEEYWDDLSPDEARLALRNNALPIANTPEVKQGKGLIDLVPSRRLRNGSWDVPNVPAATGIGSLDASRGSHVVEFVDDEGTFHRLDGNRDFTGEAWEPGAWAGSMWSGSMWSGSMWSGSMWSGSMWSGEVWE